MSVDAAVQALVQQTVSAMLPQIVAAVSQQIGQTAAPAPLIAAAPALVAAAPVADAFGLTAAAPAPAAAVAVTSEMIQALITPLVANEQSKAALQAEMLAMGIQNLPDTRPDQLTELYNRFEAVRVRFAGAATTAAAAPSII